MSFREKAAWISIVSMLAIYGLYFRSVIRSGSTASGVHFGGLLITTIALVVVQIVLTVVAAIFAPREAKAPRDERDRLIELKATRAAYAVVMLCVVSTCFLAGFVPPALFNTNALLVVLVIAELTRSASQIVLYRRGA